MANMPPVGIIKVSTGGSFLPFSPHRPGAFSCSHSPGPHSDYLLCFCDLSKAKSQSAIGNATAPGSNAGGC